MNDVDRPIPITVVCALGILGCLVAFFRIFDPSHHAAPAWYQPFMIVLVVASVVPYVGMWLMKRWGVILYAVLFALSEALLVLTNHFKPSDIVIPAIVLVIGFGYFADME